MPVYPWVFYSLGVTGLALDHLDRHHRGQCVAMNARVETV